MEQREIYWLLYSMLDDTKKWKKKISSYNPPNVWIHFFLVVAEITAFAKCTICSVHNNTYFFLHTTLPLSRRLLYLATLMFSNNLFQGNFPFSFLFSFCNIETYFKKKYVGIFSIFFCIFYRKDVLSENLQLSQMMSFIPFLKKGSFKKVSQHYNTEGGS